RSVLFPIELDLANRARRDVIQHLIGNGSKNLVVVKYRQDHNIHEEWVFNDADIDESRVVWTRGGSDCRKDRELLNYFRERTIWLLQPDESPPTLTLYQECSPASQLSP